MRTVTRRLRVAVAVITAVVMGSYPVYASASTAATPNLQVRSVPDVFITEFQTNGGSASQEFIELYNATDQDINFSDKTAGIDNWKIQFFNSASVKTGAPVWTTVPTASNAIVLSGIIPAHDYFVLASTNYLPGGIVPDHTYDASSSHLMTDTGGGLQVASFSDASNTGIVTAHDRIMWLAGTNQPMGVVTSPATGKSIQRLPNDNNEYINLDNSLTEYGSSDTITPWSAWLAPVLVIPDATAETTNVDTANLVEAIDPEIVTSSPTIDNTGLELPYISELLPNPASPLTDAADEFIELYNPNDAAFNLKGYALQVGSTTLHTYTFADGTDILAHGYMAFMSAETGLSLVNSAGQARLLGLSGEKISETLAYSAAADNASWSLIDDVWLWSTTATPNVLNLLTAKPVAVKASTATKKAAAVKAVKTTKAKATTTKKAATKKTTKKTTAKKATVVSAAAVTKPKPPIHPGVLVAVAIGAVLYGLYEYRHDIAHKFSKLRRNRNRSSSHRRQAAWR